MSNEKHYPLHPNQSHPPIMTCEIPLEEYESLKRENAELKRMDTEHTVQIAKMNGYISHLEEERKWRKFPDEKPTEDIKFLVINEKGMLQCCYYSLILKEFQIPVTHWMPLPKSPEVKQ